MIRIMALVAVAFALWRKVGRRKFALGLLATAGLAVIGACLGGVLGDALIDGSGTKRDLVAGAGAVLGTVLFVQVGEMLARRKRAKAPPKPTGLARFRRR